MGVESKEYGLRPDKVGWKRRSDGTKATENEMSKINGDKARHAKRSRKQSKQRVKSLELRDMFVLPLKTTLRPAAKPDVSAKKAGEKTDGEKTAGGKSKQPVAQAK
jgi:hypothetical protein